MLCMPVCLQDTDILYIVPLFFVDEWRKFIRWIYILHALDESFKWIIALKDKPLWGSFLGRDQV